MTAQAPITLAISIVSFDSDLSELRTLLDSLETALSALPAVGLSARTRISLVDNSENSQLRLTDFGDIDRRLASQGAGIELLAGHGNVGYGRGHNLVIRTVDDRYHLVLNPDVELAPDSLAVGLLYLEQHPDVALVSPYAEGGDGQKQYLCKRQPALLTLLLRGFAPAGIRKLFRRRLAHYEMHDLAEDRPSDPVTLVSGCCMLARGETLRAENGFDDNYFLYFEDFDLSLRLGSRGQVVYLPGMKIRHYGGNAAGKGLRHIRLYGMSAWRFFNTWGWRLL